MLIRKKNKSKTDFQIFFNIFLKKINSNEKQDDNYYFCISEKINSDKFDIINKEEVKFEINSNNTYYCSIVFKDNKVVIYLYYEKYSVHTLQIEKNIESIKKDDTFIFVFGNDNLNSFNKGKIGPIIMIENPKNDKNINKIIFYILSLKDKYSDYILSKYKNYYFNLKEYYEQNYNSDSKNDKNEEEKEKEKEGENQEISKIIGKLECLLYLHPNILKYSENKIISYIDNDSTRKCFYNIMSDYNNKKIKYSLIDLNISIINYKILEIYLLMIMVLIIFVYN